MTPTVAGFTGYAMYSFKNDSSKGGVEGHGGESDRYASLAARYKAGALEAVLVADTTMYGTYRTGTAASKDDGWTVTFGGNEEILFQSTHPHGVRRAGLTTKIKDNG